VPVSFIGEVLGENHRPVAIHSSVFW